MKWDELDLPSKERVRNEFREEVTRFNSYHLDAVQGLVKALFVLNGGGAIAVVTFMGTTPEARDLQVPYYALLFYVIGVIFVMLINLFRTVYTRKYLLSLVDKRDKFISGEISGGEYYESHISKTPDYVFIILTIISIITFLIGSSLGYKTIANPKLRKTPITDQGKPVTVSLPFGKITSVKIGKAPIATP
jgi:hypothetical protein